MRRRKGHALTKDDLADGAIAFYAVEIVLDDGVVKAGDNGVLMDPGSDGLVDDLGHENGTMLAERDALGCPSSRAAELLDLSDAGEFTALLLDEGACAGAACLVHRAVDHAAVFQADILCVLTADFKDGVDARIVVAGARGMCGDFVLDKDGGGSVTIGEKGANDLPSAPRDTRSANVLSAGGAFEELAPQALRRLDGTALGLAVGLQTVSCVAALSATALAPWNRYRVRE